MRAQKRAGAIVHLPFVLRVVLLAAEPLCVVEVEPPGSALESAVAALHLGDGEDVRTTDDHGGGVFAAGALMVTLPPLLSVRLQPSAVQVAVMVSPFWGAYFHTCWWTPRDRVPSSLRVTT